jgi:hypothetical protein
MDWQEFPPPVLCYYDCRHGRKMKRLVVFGNDERGLELRFKKMTLPFLLFQRPPRGNK